MDYEALRASVGRVVRSQRYKVGYSQEGFANEAGMHRTYMGAIERGEQNVSLHTLVRIANALKVPLSQLIEEAEELTMPRDS